MSAHGETQHTCDQCDVIMDVVHMIVEQVVMDNINQKRKRKNHNMEDIGQAVIDKSIYTNHMNKSKSCSVLRLNANANMDSIIISRNNL